MRIFITTNMTFTSSLCGTEFWVTPRRWAHTGSIQMAQRSPMTPRKNGTRASNWQARSPTHGRCLHTRHPAPQSPTHVYTFARSAWQPSAHLTRPAHPALHVLPRPALHASRLASPVCARTQAQHVSASKPQHPASLARPTPRLGHFGQAKPAKHVWSAWLSINSSQIFWGSCHDFDHFILSSQLVKLIFYQAHSICLRHAIFCILRKCPYEITLPNWLIIQKGIFLEYFLEYFIFHKYSHNYRRS